VSVTLRTGSKAWTPRALAPAGLLLLGVALASCGSRVKVTVVNASREPLSELRVAAEGDSTRVKPVPPGGSVTVRAAVHGEDAIVLRGNIGDRPLTPMMASYVEGGYAIRMIVDSTGFVTVVGPKVIGY
jgi:hypothetical protein